MNKWHVVENAIYRRRNSAVLAHILRRPKAKEIHLQNRNRGESASVAAVAKIIFFLPGEMRINIAV